MKNKEWIINSLNLFAKQHAERVCHDGTLVICLSDMVFPEEQKCMYRVLSVLSCFGKVEVVDWIDRDTHIDTLAKIKFTPFTRSRQS